MSNGQLLGFQVPTFLNSVLGRGRCSGDHQILIRLQGGVVQEPLDRCLCSSPPTQWRWGHTVGNGSWNIEERIINGIGYQKQIKHNFTILYSPKNRMAMGCFHDCPQKYWGTLGIAGKLARTRCVATSGVTIWLQLTCCTSGMGSTSPTTTWLHWVWGTVLMSSKHVLTTGVGKKRALCRNTVDCKQTICFVYR